MLACKLSTVCFSHAGGLDKKLPNVHRIVAAFANTFARDPAPVAVDALQAAFDVVVPVSAAKPLDRKLLDDSKDLQRLMELCEQGLQQGRCAGSLCSTFGMFGSLHAWLF